MNVSKMKNIKEGLDIVAQMPKEVQKDALGLIIGALDGSVTPENYKEKLEPLLKFLPDDEARQSILKHADESLEKFRSQTERPLRSVKMTAKVKKAWEEKEKWFKAAKKRAKEIDDEGTRLSAEAVDMKERFWATVAVDMGLTSSRYRMTVRGNDICILEERGK